MRAQRKAAILANFKEKNCQKHLAYLANAMFSCNLNRSTCGKQSSVLNIALSESNPAIISVSVPQQNAICDITIASGHCTRLRATVELFIEPAHQD